MSHDVPRREFLRRVSVGTLGAAALGPLAAAGGEVRDPKSGQPSSSCRSGGQGANANGPHVLPKLPYDFDALEPHMDERTVRIHHGKHHAGYVAKLNAALKGHPDLASKSLYDLLANAEKVPAEIKQAVINSGFQHANHSLYWASMAPAGKGGGGEPTGELASAVKSAFGSFATFREALTKAAATQFGSGWAWLVMDGSAKLQAYSTSNADSPLMRGHKPILVIDVWEHAYYLKYQNRRSEFIKAWWNLVNWPGLAERFAKAS